MKLRVPMPRSLPGCCAGMQPGGNRAAVAAAVQQRTPDQRSAGSQCRIGAAADRADAECNHRPGIWWKAIMQLCGIALNEVVQRPRQGGVVYVLVLDGPAAIARGPASTIHASCRRR